MEKLHPGVKWLWRVKSWFKLIFLSLFIMYLVVFNLITAFGDFVHRNLGLVSFTLFVLWMVIIFVLSEIYARMAYNRWFYEFTPASLKLESGIIWKKYANIPYARIQNVEVRRGIIARICGFSTIDIQTAGFSHMGRGGILSEGHIPAVNIQTAEKIREFLIRKFEKRQRSGL